MMAQNVGEGNGIFPEKGQEVCYDPAPLITHLEEIFNQYSISKNHTCN